MKPKVGSLKKSTKLINDYPNSSKKKRERVQINKNRNEKEVTADAAEMQRLCETDMSNSVPTKWTT